MVKRVNNSGRMKRSGIRKPQQTASKKPRTEKNGFTRLEVLNCIHKGEHNGKLIRG